MPGSGCVASDHRWITAAPSSMVTAALEWLPSNESGRLDYEAQAIALDDR